MRSPLLLRAQRRSAIEYRKLGPSMSFPPYSQASLTKPNLDMKPGTIC